MRVDGCTLTPVNTPLEPKLLLSIPDLAAATSLSRSMIYTLIAAGQIAVVHVGRSARVTRAEAQRFVDSLVDRE
jgi:excisionase family DNA binding protein